MAAKFLGIDVGDARVGVAIAEADIDIAHPRVTLPAASAVSEIVAIVDDEDVVSIVLGWPLQMDGSEGLATRRVEVFEKRLIEALDTRDIKIFRWDERLSTTAAENFLISADVSRARRKLVVDQLAAAHILQGWLDGSDRSERSDG